MLFFQMDRHNMPPPKTSGSRRRRPRRTPSSSSITLKGLGVSSPTLLLPTPQETQSTPSTPHQPRARSGTHGPDSDSDTACGFGDTWKMTV
jgi:hypothetical protein